MTIKEWQVKINKWAEEKGWNGDLRQDADSIGKQIANMHSELTEAWEEIRKGYLPTDCYNSTDDRGYAKPEGFGMELADCVIRIMHTCEFYGIDLEKLIEIKMDYNETRSFRHGGKKA